MCLVGVLLLINLRLSLSKMDSTSLSRGDMWGLMANLVEASLVLLASIVETQRELMNLTSMGLGLLLLEVYFPSLTQSRIELSESSLFSGFRAETTA